MPVSTVQLVTVYRVQTVPGSLLGPGGRAVHRNKVLSLKELLGVMGGGVIVGSHQVSASVSYAGKH